MLNINSEIYETNSKGQYRISDIIQKFQSIRINQNKQLDFHECQRNEQKHQKVYSTSNNVIHWCI